MSVPVQVRPLQPHGVPLPWLRPGFRAAAAHAGFDIDGAGGTVTWHRERDGVPVRLSLPGRGAPALAAVTVVSTVQAAYFSVGLYKRLVLSDAAGRTLDQTTPQEEQAFDALWPAGCLRPLAEAGVAVRQQHVGSRRELEETFPGADPHWRRHTGGAKALRWGGATVVLVVLAVLVLGFYG